VNLARIGAVWLVQPKLYVSTLRYNTMPQLIYLKFRFHLEQLVSKNRHF
jgi:hypothetical protein